MKTPAMQYRRFGRTNLNLSVFSCGGMRFQQSWQDRNPEKLQHEIQDNLEKIIHRALDLGINHIETARGYGSSEYQLGLILPDLPRDEIIVQTKITPADSEKAFLDHFDESMKNLKLDYVDLLAVHGINNAEVLDKTLHGGTASALEKLRADGRVRHLGFSTHGDGISNTAVINTDLFDYVNLHWYYIDQDCTPAIEAAREHDMGVFIISPSDKGGQLYAPPERLTELCAPLHPMAFNNLYCLSRPEIHTLSIGAASPSDFDAHMATLEYLDDPERILRPILRRLRKAAEERLGSKWMQNWNKNLPHFEDTPGEVPLYHVLRMYTLAAAFDMHDFCKMRYNLLGNSGHWFAGKKVVPEAWQQLPEMLKTHPLADQLLPAIQQAHKWFDAEDKKRLSESSE